MKKITKVALTMAASILILGVGGVHSFRDYENEIKLKNQLQLQGKLMSGWLMGKEVKIIDAKGSHTAKAGMKDGSCNVWVDGDAATKHWDLILGKKLSGKFIALHELAHCSEEIIGEYKERKTNTGNIENFRTSREVFADAAALGEMWRVGEITKERLTVMKKMPKGNPHDTSFASSCVLNEGINNTSDEVLETAKKCARLSLLRKI